MRLLRPTRAIKRFGRLAIDTYVATAMMMASFWLRVGFDTTEQFINGMIYSFIYGAVCICVFSATRLSFHSWRYTSTHDFMSVIRDVTLTIALFMGLSFFAIRLFSLPRSVPLIAWSLVVIGLCGTRILYRFWQEGSMRLPTFSKNAEAPDLYLAYGANVATEDLIRLLHRSSPSAEIIGIIDDDPARRDQYILGHRVLGGLAHLPKLMQRFTTDDTIPTTLILSAQGLTRQETQTIFDAASASGLRVVRTPDPAQFLDTRHASVTFEPIKVGDILGREPANLLYGEIKALIAGKTVLVTGGGGSIGSEICRQVCARGPARLMVIDHSEFNLFNIQQELEKSWPGITFSFYLESVRDRAKIEDIFSKNSIDLVFHAAAYKHVPIVEQNPVAGISTNVFGTKNVADAALKHGIAAMIVISTDKAVRPKSVMGLSKRIAEAYCQTLDLTSPTRFITVRFGNVLGSSGSVVPIFEQQIRNGGPVTITHKDMTRYFMTIPEASQLVLQATILALAQNEVRAGIMVLDMGQPVRIVDLANRMIALAGLVPGKDIHLEFTGLRPGEKLYEELFEADERTQQTDIPGVLLSRSRLVDKAHLNATLAIVEKQCIAGMGGEAVAALWALDQPAEQKLAS